MTLGPFECDSKLLFGNRGIPLLRRTRAYVVSQKHAVARKGAEQKVHPGNVAERLGFQNVWLKVLFLSPLQLASTNSAKCSQTTAADSKGMFTPPYNGHLSSSSICFFPSRFQSITISIIYTQENTLVVADTTEMWLYS